MHMAAILLCNVWETFVNAVIMQIQGFKLGQVIYRLKKKNQKREDRYLSCVPHPTLLAHRHFKSY